MVIAGQWVRRGVSCMTRQGIDKQIEKFGLRRNFQFGVGMFPVKLHGLC